MHTIVLAVSSSAKLDIITSPGVEGLFGSFHTIATKDPIEASKLLFILAVISSIGPGGAHFTVSTIWIEADSTVLTIIG